MVAGSRTPYQSKVEVWNTLFPPDNSVLNNIIIMNIYLQLRTHSTMESAYKYVSKSCLPREYLPDDYKGPNIGSTQEVTGIFVLQQEDRECVNELVSILTDRW